MDSSRLSVIALLVAAASSAAAAVIVHMLWAPGTIAGAAAMPVLVALLDELLRHPAEHLRRVSREPAGGLRLAQQPSNQSYRVYRSRPRWWRVAVTGIAAFALGGTALTGAELVMHRALGDRTERTTLLGDPRAPSQSPSASGGTPVTVDQAPKVVVVPRDPRPIHAHDHRRHSREAARGGDRPKVPAVTTPVPSAPLGDASSPTVTSTTPTAPPASGSGQTPGAPPNQ